MQPVTIPELYCPISSANNPEVETIEQGTNDWVRQYGLISGSEAERRFHAGRYGALASRIHPSAQVEAVGLVARWIAWLFVFDDRAEHEGWGHDPDELRTMTDRFLTILRSPWTEKDCGNKPLDAALRDLTKQVLWKCDPGWAPHFVAACEEYFAAVAWEAENRATQTVPDLDEYLSRRDHTSAILPSFALDEIVDAIVLPGEVRDHPDVRHLIKMANNLVCWHNDIFSGPKEIRHSDPHNFVLLVRHYRRCSLQEAVDFVAAAHDKAMHEFIGLAERPPTFHGDAARSLSRYISMLRHWVRANLDWSLETGRFPSYEELALS